MIKRYFYPKIGQSLLLLLLCLGLQLFIGVIIGIVSMFRGASQDITVISLVFSIFATLLTAIFGVWRSKTTIKAFFSGSVRNKQSYVYSLFLFIGVYFAVSLLGGILETFIPVNEGLNEMFVEGFNNWTGILTIVVLGPIFEELLFRGVILRGYLKNYSPSKAVIISSLLFGVLHMNIIQSITAGILGLALGYVFVKTGSLWASIFFHILNNGLSTVLYHITTRYEISDTQFLFIVIPSIVLGAAGFYLLNRMENNISPILQERDEILIQDAAAEALAVQEAQQFQSPMYYEAPQIPLKHSGMGIASFVISIVTGLGNIVAFISVIAVSVLYEAQIPKPAVISAFFMILFTLGNIAGLGLGIAGAVEKNKKRVFAVLGIIFNTVIILSFASIVLFGLFINKSIPAGTLRFDI